MESSKQGLKIHQARRRKFDVLIDEAKVYILKCCSSSPQKNLKHCIYLTPVRKELERSPDEAVSCITSTGTAALVTHSDPADSCGHVF